MWLTALSSPSCASVIWRASAYVRDSVVLWGKQSAWISASLSPSSQYHLSLFPPFLMSILFYFSQDSKSEEVTGKLWGCWKRPKTCEYGWWIWWIYKMHLKVTPEDYSPPWIIPSSWGQGPVAGCEPIGNTEGDGWCHPRLMLEKERLSTDLGGEDRHLCEGSREDHMQGPQRQPARKWGPQPYSCKELNSADSPWGWKRTPACHLQHNGSLEQETQVGQAPTPDHRNWDAKCVLFYVAEPAVVCWAAKEK